MIFLFHQEDIYGRYNDVGVEHNYQATCLKTNTLCFKAMAQQPIISQLFKIETTNHFSFNVKTATQF